MGITVSFVCLMGLEIILECANIYMESDNSWMNEIVQKSQYRHRIRKFPAVQTFRSSITQHNNNKKTGISPHLFIMKRQERSLTQNGVVWFSELRHIGTFLIAKLWKIAINISNWTDKESINSQLIRPMGVFPSLDRFAGI